MSAAQVFSVVDDEGKIKKGKAILVATVITIIILFIFRATMVDIVSIIIGNITTDVIDDVAAPGSGVSATS
jgi:hypothetical protein